MVGINKAGKPQYGKILWGLASLVSGTYVLLQSHPIFLIPMGAFFLFEHIWNWGNFTLYDFFGHEYLGLLLIVLGIILKGEFSVGSIFGLILIFICIKLNLNTEKKYFSKELKNIFRRKK